MKKSLIVINSYKEKASVLSEEVGDFLKDHEVECSYYSYNGRTYDNPVLPLTKGCCDFVITMGGDGTVLFVSRVCAVLDIPVFPINFGEFGFLAAVQQDNWKNELLQFLQGKSYIGNRNLIDIEVIRESKSIFKSLGMNDAVISSEGSSSLINLNVAYNHALLGPFKANGIIVSTATGSTAYSAAAGGPIADPSLDILILTPISSFSLSARPLIFGRDSELAITVMPSRADIRITADGQTNFELKENDVVILGVSKYKAHLISSTQEKFYLSLRSKLNWSGGPHA